MKYYKCIKDRCPMYLESDIFETCKLVLGKGITDECIGFNNIQPQIEKLTCEIAILTNKINTLEPLKDWIKDNQERDG